MADQAENLRTYLRAFIVLFFLGCFAYVLHRYVGLEEGMIKPAVVYSWLTGLIMGFIAFYFTEDFNKLIGRK